MAKNHRLHMQLKSLNDNKRNLVYFTITAIIDFHRCNLIRIDLDLMDFFTTDCYRCSFSAIFRLHEWFVYLLSC